MFSYKLHSACTLNWTILQTWRPSFVPAPFHASSPSALAFLICENTTCRYDVYQWAVYMEFRAEKMPSIDIHTNVKFSCLTCTCRLTCFSSSEPNWARLVSFQLYFFCFFNAAIVLTEQSRSSFQEVHSRAISHTLSPRPSQPALPLPVPQLFLLAGREELTIWKELFTLRKHTHQFLPP